MILQFFIINKSGGLIYKYERSSSTQINKLLVLSSTIHSLCTMFEKIYPCEKKIDSKQMIRLDGRTITFYKTGTEVSFVFVSTESCYKIIKIVYKMYCDFVSKDPFYEIDMPIKNDLFNPEPFFNELI
ncbi:transport particle complex subunit [Tubulinosema ratisbonensis]|uniref:Trafficking protein particle complex subunit n=1 Tax=Tubulinosema ratisbonensis TaxID=291195 RepID=A0A437AN34_9MICR|nr:transport particle complex subunit [Tubulinosema ratisbonensis]